jgi:peptide/nickel transport system permease protein
MIADMAGRSPATLAWHRFAAEPVAALAGLFLVALVLLTAAAPLIEAWLMVDPNAVDLLARLEPPSAAHLLGTDELGRDVLLRLLRGGRISLAVGLCGALLAALIGTVVGLVAGYAGGAVDGFLMRLTDAVIALPLLPILIVLAAVDLGKLGLPAGVATGELASVLRIVVIVALFGWTTTARLVRASVLSLRTREFVHAARALGAGPARILRRHILPNALAPLIVATTLSIGNVILAESVLSFLGLGVQPPLPSWGNMLTGAQELLFESPRLALWPGLLIFLTVLAFNLLGDGLQAALDPRRG